jgi:hypothetical protein
MSTLKVDTITKADGTNSISQDAIITTSSPQLGRRNLIINGAMQVAQRGTSVTGLQNSPAYLVDRFSYRRGGSWSSFQATMSQEDVTGVPGFRKSVKLSTTTAETNTSSSAAISTSLEGQDLAGFNWGTSDAKSITLSFWVKSNVTGSHQFWCSTVSNTADYYFTSYTISSADTWEYKTITIPANLVQPTTINTSGLDIYWQYSGNTSAATPTQDTWVTNLGWSTLSGVADLATSTSNYLELTGVQLEVGSVATPFEHRSYGEELALCERYYQLGEVQSNGSAFGGESRGSSWERTVQMRAAPTMTTTSSNLYNSGGGAVSGTIAYAGNTAKNLSLRVTGTNTATLIICSYTADAEL